MNERTGRLLTIEDIELFYTGAMGHPFIVHSDLVDILKATGEVSTAVTGVLNKTYGALVWAQMNQEANVFGALPKTTWVRSGWRVKKDFATSAAGDIALSGETATLPSAVRPDIATINATPKIQAITFDVTDVVEALASQSADDIWGAAHQVRAEIGTEFVKRINQQLLRAADSSTAMLETLDRICGKNAEGANYGTIYGISRSTNSWAEAYVNSSSSGRSLTDALVRDVLTGTRSRGGNTSVIITGYDTYAALLGLYTTFVRYMPLSETKAQFGVNGVQTAAGLDVGINVAALYGIPLIQSVDCPISTNGSISNMYFVDASDPENYGFPRLSISVLRPVEYFESRDYVVLNKFVVRGVYRMIGETVARFLSGQGKLRDISA
jgi:hypothetical protein